MLNAVRIPELPWKGHAFFAVTVIALALVTWAATAEGEEAHRAVVTTHAGTADASLNRLSREEVMDVLKAADWPAGSRDEALSVSFCESTWDPTSIGRYGELGIFQIHPVNFHRFHEHFGPHADAADPYQNTIVALEIWREYGWTHWTCQPGDKPLPGSKR